jgi:hypothetical protein
MTPLCPDCDTEHQPQDHSADQWPENRRQVGQEQLLRSTNLQHRISVISSTIEALDATLKAVPELGGNELRQVVATRYCMVGLRSEYIVNLCNTEAELLNLIEKGPSHE